MSADVRAAICQAIAAHAHAQDDGNIEAMVALYSPDGVVEIPGVATLTGVDEIRAAFSQPGWGPDPEKPQRHMVANTEIVEATEAHVRAVSDVAMLQRGPQGWSVAVVARYHDRFVRSGDDWRFASRVDEFDM